MSDPAQIGHRTWAFPSGFMPLGSTGPEPEFTSREELCVLNPGREEVTLEVEAFLADDEPEDPFTLQVGPRRVRHMRINNLMDPRPLRLGVPYGLIVRAEHPVVAQLVRTDTRSEALAVTALNGYGTD